MISAEPSPPLQALFDELNARYFGERLRASVYLDFRPHWTDGPWIREPAGGEVTTTRARYDPPRRRIYFHPSAFSPLLIEPGLSATDGLRKQIRRTLLHEMCHAFGKGHCSHGRGWEAKMRYLASVGETWATDAIVRARSFEHREDSLHGRASQFRMPRTTE